MPIIVVEQVVIVKAIRIASYIKPTNTPHHWKTCSRVYFREVIE